MRGSASDVWLTEREPRMGPVNGLASTCGRGAGTAGSEESGQISEGAVAAGSEALALLDQGVILRLRENKASKNDSTEAS
jgi:hypothetical protein